MLDFARPIKFDLAPADLNALCDDAARGRQRGHDRWPSTLDLDRRSLPVIVTDAERLRLALVNILTNARHAVAGPDRGAAARCRSA